MRQHIDIVNQFLKEQLKNSKKTNQLTEAENIEEIGKLGRAVGAAGMAGLAMTGAAAPAAAQTTNAVRPDIFVQYDINHVVKEFTKNIDSAKKTAPNLAAKIDQLMQDFNELNKKGQQLVWNMQSGMNVPTDASQMSKWIQFTARNINIAHQMQ